MAVAEQESSRADSIEVRGLVVPAQWDASGKVVGVAIAGFDESEYLVSPGVQADRLLGLINKEVSVIGRSVFHSGRKKMIQVERCQVETKAGKGVGHMALVLGLGCLLALGPASLVMAADQEGQGAQVSAPTAKKAAPVKKQAKAKKAVKARKAAKAKKVMANQKVRAAQAALSKVGFKLKADGIYGKRTRLALIKFQKSKGLKATGKLDQATAKALGV